MVHPAAVSDTLLRWAAETGYTGGKTEDPGAVALLLRAACDLWRASPNDVVRARQLEHVQALTALLRNLSNLDKAGTRDHWGPASPAQTPDSDAQWNDECTWSASNTLYGTKPKPHGGTAAMTASAGHALLDTHEVLVAEGDNDTSALVRAAAESAAEWIVEECGHVRTAAGVVFRWAPGMAHQVHHANAAAASFLARAALALSREAWLKLAVAAVPSLAQSEIKHKGKASAFPLAAEDSGTVDIAQHARICESLAVIHRATGSAEAELLLRRGGAYIRNEIAKSPDASLGARAHAACMAASMCVFKQIEDADGDEALAHARMVSEQMTSLDAGMRASDDSGVFLSAAGEPLPMVAQAMCAHAFGLLLEAPEYKQATVGQSGAGSSAARSSLSDLVMSVLEPGVSTATHIMMQISLVIMFIVLAVMIAVYGPNIHLIAMFSLGIGLVLSYMWFMAALSEMEDEQGDEQPGVHVEGPKNSTPIMKQNRSEKTD